MSDESVRLSLRIHDEVRQQLVVESLRDTKLTHSSVMVAMCSGLTSALAGLT